jgi:hypothetical protein
MSTAEYDVQHAWKQFLAMPEATTFHRTNRNASLLQSEVLAGDLPYTANALLLAFRKLKDALDKPAPTPIPIEPPIAVAEVREEDLPDYPVRGSLENGWKYQQRLTAWRERRKQREWREQENQRLLNTPPAQSTIRRTNTERKLVQQQNDL